MRRFTSILLFLLLIFLLTNQAKAQPHQVIYDRFDMAYHWLEILDTGEPLVEIRDNDFQGPYPIGFEFPFFDFIAVRRRHFGSAIRAIYNSAL